MWRSIPKIITAAATSPFGILALVIATFRVVSRTEGLSEQGFDPSTRALDKQGRANALLGLGDLESEHGRNDQAREAYAEARTLYKQEQNLLGQAHVLLGLGELESKLGRNDQAKKNFDQAAHGV